MGYYSNFEGSIEFSRDLTADELDTLRRLAKADMWNVFVVDSETIWAEDELKAYEWERVLQMLIDALPADVMASGYIERAGEESPNMDRLYALGRRVVLVKPEIRWPDPK